LPRKFWRKGSQWFALTRRHALVVAAELELVEAFGRYCSTDTPSDVAEKDGVKPFCAPDEHFVPTLLATKGLESDLVSRSVTYAHWWPTKRRHPKRFAAQETSVDLIRHIANRTATTDVFEDEPNARVNCGWFASGKRAGTPKPCFLFARKFTEKAGRRVGAFASVAIGF
jgi:hypothetical protein